MIFHLFKKKPAAPSLKTGYRSSVVFSPIEAAREESTHLQLALHQATHSLELLQQEHRQQQQTLILQSVQLETLQDEVRTLENAKARAEVARRAAERDAERAHQTRQKIEAKLEQMFNLKAEMEANKASSRQVYHELDDLGQRCQVLNEAYEQAKQQAAQVQQQQMVYHSLHPLKEQMMQILRETCQQGQAQLAPFPDDQPSVHPLESLVAQLNSVDTQYREAVHDTLLEQELAWLRELIYLIEQTRWLQQQWQQRVNPAEPRSHKPKPPALSLRMIELETQLLTAYENFEVYCQQHAHLQPAQLLTALMTLMNTILPAFAQLPDNPLTLVLGETLSQTNAGFYLHQYQFYLKNTDQVNDIPWVTQVAIPTLINWLRLIQLDTLQASGFNYDQANFLYLGNCNALEQIQSRLALE